MSTKRSVGLKSKRTKEFLKKTDKRRKESELFLPENTVQGKNEFMGNPVKALIFGKNGMKFTHRYFTRVSIDPGIGGIAAGYSFRANGMFDPDATGTGHQPIGYDQVSVLFNHWTVIAAKCRVDFINTDATNSSIVGLVVNDDATVGTDIDVIIENGKCVWNALTPAGGSQAKCTLIQQLAIAKYFHRKTILTDSELRGDVSTDPVEQVFFVLVGASTLSADPGTIHADVQIDYVAVWTEPAEITKS